LGVYFNVKLFLTIIYQENIMKKARVLFVFIIAFSLTFSAFVTAGEKKIQIGLCMASLDTFLSSLAAAALQLAQESNVELITMDAQDDSIRQVDQVMTFLSSGVDALIVNVVETNAASRIVAAAETSNTPVIFVNRNPFFQKEIPANNYVVSPNTLLEGANGMEYAGKLMNGKGNIVILQGTLGHEAATMRTEGVKMVIRDKYPEIKVLSEETGDWFRDKGMTVMENLITAYSDQINAVLSNNDEMALGALLALKMNGMDDVLVIGVDGTPDGVGSVASGTGLTATAYQDPIAQGAGSVKLALKVLAHEKVEQLNLLPVRLVTKDNFEEFKR
jgi:inositol transport system substrate-binding protein